MTYKFLDVIKTTKLPEPVTCGSCPVNLSCAVSEGGNGFVFDCCHSAGFETTVNGKRVLYVIDCQRHSFEQNDVAKECKKCPLCTGDIMEVVLRDVSQSNQYVPTAYAKIPVEERIDAFRKGAERARKRLKEERG